ncbi:MAG: response regulator [Chthoniobacterales bacterium]
MKRILVIEDEASIRNNLLHLLKSEGFDALGADDGISGISAAEKHVPDLVLCDLVMPELDGYGVPTSLRSDRQTSGVPFSFLTAHVDHQDIRFLHSVGCEQMQGYLFSRPISAAEYTALLENRAGMNLDAMLSADL